MASDTAAAAKAAAAAEEPPASRSVRIADPSEPLDVDAYNSRWHSIWEAGLQKGQRFDAGRCSPLLLQLLGPGGAAAAKGARVLVPGCGRGYDVIAAAAAGADLAVGLDICSKAVAAADAERDATAAADVAARARFEQADFFAYSHPGGPFDIGYDYTFLCALPPQLRRSWAQAWAKLLKPGGQLVTLIFPVDPTADPTMGPPFPVTPELYTDLLTGAGFEAIELERVPEGLSHPARAGREWLGRWRAPGAGSASSHL